MSNEVEKQRAEKWVTIYWVPSVASGILLNKCFSNLIMGMPREVEQYNGYAKTQNK